MSQKQTNELPNTSNSQAEDTKSHSRLRPSKRTAHTVGAVVAAGTLLAGGAHVNDGLHRAAFGSDRSYSTDEHGHTNANLLSLIEQPVHIVYGQLEDQADRLKDALVDKGIYYYVGNPDGLTTEEVGRIIGSFEDDGRSVDDDFPHQMGGRPLINEPLN